MSLAENLDKTGLWRLVGNFPFETLTLTKTHSARMQKTVSAAGSAWALGDPPKLRVFTIGGDQNLCYKLNDVE